MKGVCLRWHGNRNMSHFEETAFDTAFFERRGTTRDELGSVVGKLGCRVNCLDIYHSAWLSKNKQMSVIWWTNINSIQLYYIGCEMRTSQKKHLRVINCGETSWWNSKWRRGTPHSNMHPVSTWRHQQMANRQHRLALCSRAQRSERRRWPSFGSAGNVHDAISSNVLEGWNRVAEWRIPQGENLRSRGIGCTQG